MERAHHQTLLHTEEFRTDIVNIEFQPSPMILHILHQVHRSVLYIYIYIERERERERERGGGGATFDVTHFESIFSYPHSNKSYFIKITQSLYSLTHIALVIDCFPYRTDSVLYQLPTVFSFKSLPRTTPPTYHGSEYTLTDQTQNVLL
jgi:hypothetical protein